MNVALSILSISYSLELSHSLPPPSLALSLSLVQGKQSSVTPKSNQLFVFFFIFFFTLCITFFFCYLCYPSSSASSVAFFFLLSFGLLLSSSSLLWHPPVSVMTTKAFLKKKIALSSLALYEGMGRGGRDAVKTVRMESLSRLPTTVSSQECRSAALI